MIEAGRFTRRKWLSSLLMAAGLAASYGTLAVEGLLFLLPPRIRPRTRKLFAGNLDQYSLGSVQTFLDLQGTEILVKRSDKGLKAFGSICPHLGCHVHWETEKQRFFCPCHNGIFDAEGVAISGPPAAAGQRLAEVSLEINEKSGVVYIEVKDVKRKRV